MLGTRAIPPLLGQPGPGPGASPATGSHALLTGCCSLEPQKSMSLHPFFPSLPPPPSGSGILEHSCSSGPWLQLEVLSARGGGVARGRDPSFHGFLLGRWRWFPASLTRILQSPRLLSGSHRSGSQELPVAWGAAYLDGQPCLSAEGLLFPPQPLLQPQHLPPAPPPGPLSGEAVRSGSPPHVAAWLPSP